MDSKLRCLQERADDVTKQSDPGTSSSREYYGMVWTVANCRAVLWPKVAAAVQQRPAIMRNCGSSGTCSANFQEKLENQIF